MMKKTHSGVLFAAWFFIVVAIISGFALLYVGIAEGAAVDSIRASILSQMKGSLGDILAGTVGVCLSFSATLFMVVTFREQRKQHKEQLQQSSRERFENTFFNMLSMFHNVRAAVGKYLSEMQRVSSLEDYYDGFKKYCSDGEPHAQLMRIEQILSDRDLNGIELEKAEEGLGKLYADYVDRGESSIGYFFRYIHNMIAFVINQWGDSEESAADVKRYLNLIQAQMSDEELGLIFYDAISPYGLNRNYDKQFKHNLDRYGFLENISRHILLNRNDHRIYRATIFKFLNAEEQKRKIGSGKRQN